MAQSDRKTIIVDTDLRRPVQHKIFNLPNRHGLTDLILNQDLNVENRIQATSIDNLFLLSSGSLPPNPTEMLLSKRMKHIIQSLKDQSDIVIFDSPPVLVVADAAILSTDVDGVVVVNDVGKTRSGALKRTIEELNRGRANVVGVVLNRVSARASGYYYNYYYYYHYYGEDAQDKPRKHHRGPGRFLKLPSFSSPKTQESRSSD